MNYLFKWRRRLRTHTRQVVGHKYDPVQEKMCLYYADGSIEEIADWKHCSVKLGVDWLLAAKAEMEKKSGISIPLNVEATTG